VYSVFADGSKEIEDIPIEEARKRRFEYRWQNTQKRWDRKKQAIVVLRILENRRSEGLPPQILQSANWLNPSGFDA
jgi:hypothetical protein